jgi:enamine deaminase RidA (YjgF/YER057c/UK114 family)
MFKNNRVPEVMLLLLGIVILSMQLLHGQGPAAKQNQSDQIQFLNPTGLSTPPGYTHVVIVQSGKLVYVSGQVSLDSEGKVVGIGDLRSQTAQAMENLKLALAAAGATPQDVVKLNYYVVNLKPSQLLIIREVRSKYFSAEHPPASTLVGVTASE